MITLYIRKGCPYCAKTVATAEMLDIPFEEKDIDAEGISEELVARGGKLQAPYIIDSETGTEMYESDAIVTYLHEHFGKDT